MKVLLTGGGTGGHIYPALALAKNIREHYPQAELLYVGTKTGLEADIVTKTDIPMSYIQVSGFKRSLSFHNFKVIYQFITACRQVKKIFQTFQPDVVVGTGGYVAGPVVYMAKQCKIPSIIHEQNAIPGLTNTFLSHFADVVAVTFPETQAKFSQAAKVVVTGNPRASEVALADKQHGITSLGVKADMPTVLALGGSRGAKAINDFMETLLDSKEELPFQLIFVTGNVHYDRFKMKGKRANVHIHPYIYNMPEVLACADLVIGRAGATFLAEVTSLGIPSILIPSPYVTNNHQFHNAKALEKQGAAIVVEEKNIEAAKLKETINNLIHNKSALEELQSAAKNLGKPDSADTFRKEIEALVRRKR